jgi:hypothetical protein
MSDNQAGGNYRSETHGEIAGVHVTVTVEGENEHLADLIHTDLTSRADELNQIVELDRHPDATNPPTRADWEGWFHGEYDDIDRSVDTDTDQDGDAR